MTFRERYVEADNWQSRATIMEAYHLLMIVSKRRWSVTSTAKYFGVSIGLTSENLRLAEASHINSKILTLASRQEALRSLRNGHYD